MIAFRSLVSLIILIIYSDINQSDKKDAIAPLFFLMLLMPRYQSRLKRSPSTNPSLDITPLIMLISYAISGAIALAAIAAFLRQLFNLGRE